MLGAGWMNAVASLVLRWPCLAPAVLREQLQQLVTGEAVSVVPPSFAAGEGSSTEVARLKLFQQPVGKQDSEVHLQATTLCRLSSLGRRARAHQHSDGGRRSDGVLPPDETAIGTFLQRRCRVALGSLGRAGGHEVPRGQ